MCELGILAIIQKRNLAKFSYRSWRKVDFWEPCYILRASWKLWSKSGDFNCSLMGIGNFVPIFKITSFAAVYFMSPRYEISRPKKR
jgi:hypothetical protein